MCISLGDRVNIPAYIFSWIQNTYGNKKKISWNDPISKTFWTEHIKYTMGKYQKAVNLQKCVTKHKRRLILILHFSSIERRYSLQSIMDVFHTDHHLKDI